jgi:hypothetical protein
MISNEPNTTALLAGDFISEDAVRGAAADETPAPTRRTAPLRRWSVGELIARAFAARRAEGMSH